MPKSKRLALKIYLEIIKWYWEIVENLEFKAGNLANFLGTLERKVYWYLVKIDEMLYEICSKCNGSGHLPHNYYAKCPVCEGAGTVDVE